MSSPVVAAPAAQDEAARLEALARCRILDTPAENVYDDLAHLAAGLCAAPMALITFLDRDRQWFKAAVGFGDRRETPRDVAFCAHALHEPGDLLVVPDTHADARFADNPLVRAAPFVRFYAGASVRSSEGGYLLGNLCVLDPRPRGLDAMQADGLRRLARQLAAHLQARRHVAELRHAEAELRATEARLHAFLENGPAVAFMKDADGRYLYVNRHCTRRFDTQPADWLGRTDAELWPPETAAPIRERDQLVLSGGRPLSHEETIPGPDGEPTHWLVYKFPLAAADGSRVLGGMSLDITGRKKAEAERERLVAELRDTLAHVKTLKGFLPICASCKNIRDDAGYWQQIESYLREHAEVEFTHGICPRCAEKLYPEFSVMRSPQPPRGK